jgi:hypothetical protein
MERGNPTKQLAGFPIKCGRPLRLTLRIGTQSIILSCATVTEESDNIQSRRCTVTKQMTTSNQLSTCTDDTPSNSTETRAVIEGPNCNFKYLGYFVEKNEKCQHNFGRKTLREETFRKT